MSQSTALKAGNAIFVSSQRATRQLVLEYEKWEMANDERKKLGITCETLEANKLTSNYIVSRQTQKSVLNKHFKQQFNGLEKGHGTADRSKPIKCYWNGNYDYILWFIWSGATFNSLLGHKAWSQVQKFTFISRWTERTELRRIRRRWKPF